MKIAHISTFYTPAIGGVKQVVEELSERQVKQGHEVHIYSSDWDKNQKIKIKEETIRGVKIHRCKHLFRLANFAVIWPSLLPRLLEKNLDIIHSHGFGHLHFILAALAAKIKKIPHIHTTHCPWTSEFRSLPGRIGILISYNIFSRLALKYTTKVIAITPWELGFIKKFGGKENQIIVIPNGTDKILFQKIKNNQFRKKHKIKQKYLVLFFGRLNPTKGPEKLAQAAINISKKRKDIAFVWVGPDEGKAQEVEKLIKNHKNMKYLGPLRGKEKIAEMYQSADVYVLPSYREGLPLTLFEAMASGLPIIASPVNGVPFEISQPENGFFANYGDIKTLEENILKILDNPKLAKKISQNNLKKARQYDWDIITKRTTDLYKQCIKNS